MTRVKRGITAKKKHKKILKKAKGYYGARSRVYRVAKQAVIKANQYAYRDRRRKKRQMRSNFILIINASLKKHLISYSKFMKILKEKKILINRKMLYLLLKKNENIIDQLIKEVK